MLLRATTLCTQKEISYVIVMRCLNVHTILWANVCEWMWVVSECVCELWVNVCVNYEWICVWVCECMSCVCVHRSPAWQWPGSMTQGWSCVSTSEDGNSQQILSNTLATLAANLLQVYIATLSMKEHLTWGGTYLSTGCLATTSLVHTRIGMLFTHYISKALVILVHSVEESDRLHHG